jgi:hypothetical protein
MEFTKTLGYEESLIGFGFRQGAVYDGMATGSRPIVTCSYLR